MIRAGVVIATQNPTDIDYRALSSAGLWCIGRLDRAGDTDGEGRRARAAEAQSRLEAATLAAMAESRLGSVVLLAGAFALACSEDQAQPIPASRAPATTDPLNAAASPHIADEQYAAAALPAEPPRDNYSGTTEIVDQTGSAFRLIEVPALDLPSIVSTPDGWFALSRRFLGSGKSIAGAETALFRSTDGVRWSSIPLDPGHDNLALRDIAYGDGTYVLVGQRMGQGGGGVFFTSNDGEHWQEIAQPTLDQSREFDTVDFAGGLFFAFGFRMVAVSADGLSWTSGLSDLVQFGSAAYGNGRYVLAGNGPMQVSEDGHSWTSVNIPCDLSDLCITDPSGKVGQGLNYHLLFIDGAFYSDQVRSTDGLVWQVFPGRFPAAYVSGRFIGGSTFHLNTWTPAGSIEPLHVIRPSAASVSASGRGALGVGKLDRDQPIPDTVEVPFEDGLDCTTASCVIVDQNLYLVPPLGTKPLPDRIPRDSDGAPLLSFYCPVSQKITCDDYAERLNCTCDPDAPAAPESCGDVGDFRCTAAFEHRDGEWDVPEVGPAACDCNAVDPNEPPTFGTHCEDDPGACAAPLQCLEVDPPLSAGPPPPPSFICTAPCTTDADCPTWRATGHCAGPVQLRCSRGSCQPRGCG